MSGSDYTTTPNLGLFKPTVNADDAQWGDHLNANADKIDAALFEGPGGAFLPVGGGTMDGPLYYTATGGTVPRSAQDRAADVANVLDFGADPTGVLDSTAAFRAAIASKPFNNGEIFIPSGQYTVTDAITIGASCVIRGAGRQLTAILIGASFNMSAQGVFVLGSDPAHAGTPTIKDLWIRFAQPNTAGMTRANLIQYPAAIFKAAATLTGRPNFENLMISSAWIGFWLDNCAAYIDNIYMSAFSYGFQWSVTTSTLDCVRISNVHFWGFDFIPTSPLGVIFLDGTTNCGWFGRVDGLYLVNFFNESSVLTIDCGSNPQGGYYFFQNIGLDGPAHLVINSNINLQLDSISNSRGNTALFTTPGIVINGGKNTVDNSYLASSNASLPMIAVQGGNLKYIGGNTAWVETDTPFMTCSSGSLEIDGVTFATHLATARATPVIAQTGTGYVSVTGCRFANFPIASVPLISITTSANAFVDANNYGGSNQALPPDYQTISFGNRSIRGDASISTAAQLSLRAVAAANGAESKLRFFGSFGAGGDFSEYLTASLRGGWTTNAWNSGYLDIWLGSAANSAADDANMVQAARFSANTLTIGNNTVAASQAIIMNAGLGVAKSFVVQSAGVNHWALQVTGAEGGGNAGANLTLNRFSDTGAALGPNFSIARATGLLTLSAGVVVTAGGDASTIDGTAIGGTTPANVTATTLRVGATTGPTWTVGSGAPGTTQPIGSLYSNTASPGAVGARLYVSQGATWLPVTGV